MREVWRVKKFPVPSLEILATESSDTDIEESCPSEASYRESDVFPEAESNRDHKELPIETTIDELFCKYDDAKGQEREGLSEGVFHARNVAIESYAEPEDDAAVDLELTLVYTDTVRLINGTRSLGFTLETSQPYVPVGFRLRMLQSGFGTVTQLDCRGIEYAVGVRSGDRVV